MRLLRTSDRTLVEYATTKIPPYAILSHRWGEDEFVLADFDRPHRFQSVGYEKITQCCRLAESEGWEYVWIDTCCIDKSSSADLTESINSMYRWYENSGICYVYLSDVSMTSNKDFQTSFRSSEWFERGWTLQELLAPERVIFYDREWLEIGDKQYLKPVITSVCRISTGHFSNPQIASVAAKMSWAAYRRTSKAEDKAYCLLGLFNVYMPLIYGEGENAFLRLQSEIIRNSSDESIFAWTDNHLLSSGLFAPNPLAFAHSGDIVPHRYSRISTKPYYLTNKGLRLERSARFVPKVEPSKAGKFGPRRRFRHKVYDTWWLPLECCKQSELDKAVMIVLQPVSGSFRRIKLQKLDRDELAEEFVQVSFDIPLWYELPTVHPLGDFVTSMVIKLGPTMRPLVSAVAQIYPSNVPMSIASDGSVVWNRSAFGPRTVIEFASTGRNLYVVLSTAFQSNVQQGVFGFCIHEKQSFDARSTSGDSKLPFKFEELEYSSSFTTTIGNGDYIWARARRPYPRDSVTVNIAMDVTSVDRSKLLPPQNFTNAEDPRSLSWSNHRNLEAALSNSTISSPGVSATASGSANARPLDGE